jgi:hypothetical protein
MSLLPPIPVNTLTTENLRQFPVWRYLHDDEGDDGTDESFITPAEEVPPAGSHGSFVVAATYLLPDGSELPGAVQLDLLGTKRQFSPILIHAAGKCLDPQAADVANRLTRLRKTPGGPPVLWILDITLPGEQAPASGRIYRSRAIQALALLAQLVSLFFTPRSR